MEILKGLLYINNVDVYETYGAFLTEEKQGDTSNYDALMKSILTPEILSLFRIGIDRGRG